MTKLQKHRRNNMVLLPGQLHRNITDGTSILQYSDVDVLQWQWWRQTPEVQGRVAVRYNDTLTDTYETLIRNNQPTRRVRSGLDNTNRNNRAINM